jgi:hypothetical protein
MVPTLLLPTGFDHRTHVGAGNEPGSVDSTNEFSDDQEDDLDYKFDDGALVSAFLMMKSQ